MKTFKWYCTKCAWDGKYTDTKPVMYRGVDWQNCPSCNAIAIPDIPEKAKKLPKPIKKWPCSVCGKEVLHPNWFMETTLCEEHINPTGKEFMTGPQPWMCECGHLNNDTWLRCDNCRRHRPADEIS